MSPKTESKASVGFKAGVKGVNGRYYWKDSSLVDRYYNSYSYDWFNRYFLLWFIFWIALVTVVIG